MAHQLLRSMLLRSGESIEIFTGRFSFLNVLQLAAKYDTVEVSGVRFCGRSFKYTLEGGAVREKLAIRDARKRNAIAANGSTGFVDEEYMRGRKIPPLPKRLVGLTVYETLVHRENLQTSNGE